LKLHKTVGIITDVYGFFYVPKNEPSIKTVFLPLLLEKTFRLKSDLGRYKIYRY